MFPAAGGDYAFMYKVLGPMFGFLNAWIMFICVMPTFFALLALTTMEYALQTIYGDCQPPDTAVRILTVLLLGKPIVLHSNTHPIAVYRRQILTSKVDPHNKRVKSDVTPFK